MKFRLSQGLYVKKELACTASLTTSRYRGHLPGNIFNYSYYSYSHQNLVSPSMAVMGMVTLSRRSEAANRAISWFLALWCISLRLEIVDRKEVMT